MTKYSAIAAMAHNRVIGKDNTMPWHLSEDLKHFKKVTMGHPIIMGRKTFLSLGRPLPGRENIVMTRNNDFSAEGVTVFTNRQQIESYLNEKGIERVFVIGGGEIYKLFSDLIDTYHITQIELDVEGDTYFPEVDWSQYKLVSSEKGCNANNLHYEFQELVRS